MTEDFARSLQEAAEHRLMADFYLPFWPTVSTASFNVRLVISENYNPLYSFTRKERNIMRNEKHPSFHTTQALIASICGSFTPWNVIVYRMSICKVT